jgi:hypothetical protein
MYKNSYAMDSFSGALVPVERYDQDEPVLSQLFVNVSPLFPSMPAESRVCLDNHLDAAIAADFTPDYFSRNTGTVFTSLRLVNKDMNEYFKRDDVLHEKTLKINQHESNKRTHLGSIRALIEGSKTKRMQHKLLDEAYFINKEKLSAIISLEIKGNHRFDPRYYSDPKKIEKYSCVSGLIEHDGLALVNLSKSETSESTNLIEPLLRLPGVSERFKDDNGKTALMWSIDNPGAFRGFQLAAKNGVNVGIDDQDKDGNTAFMLVIKKIKEMGYITDRIRQGSPTEKTDLQNMFMQTFMVDLKLMGADLTIPDGEGIVPLYILGDIVPRYMLESLDSKWTNDTMKYHFV